MGLSSDLVSQFVKVTKDGDKTKKETTVYGTARVRNGATYVQIDGSELLTPVAEAAGAHDGERVTVLIKNHKAILNGNLDSPAARTGDVTDTKLEVGSLQVRVETIENRPVVDAEEAAKTATNFLMFDSNGLQIGDNTTGTWSGFRTRISSSAFDILNAAGATLASYGEKLIDLGKNATDAVIKLCGGKGSIEYDDEGAYLQLSSDSIRLHGVEMASLYSQSKDKLGAIHAAPTEVQIVAGSGESSSNIYVKPDQILLFADDIQVNGSVTDGDTGGSYVSVVSGTSGIWTYRKYSNGDVELWGIYQVSKESCTTPIGGLYRTSALAPSGFPFAVYDANLTASYESSGYGALLWATTNTTTTAPPNYYLMRPSSGTITSGQINFHVRGKWTT